MFCLYVSATKLKGIDLDAPGNINGVPVVDVDMESFEEKPWRKPGRLVFHEPSLTPPCFRGPHFLII